MRNPTKTRLCLLLLLSGLLALSACTARAAQVKLGVALTHPTLLADKKQTTYLKIALTGFPWAEKARRTPVNVAIVIDRSGSMSGRKIEKAKEAAIMAIDRLSPTDIVSLVAYDDTISVLVPATRASDTAGIHAAIRRLEPGNTTALFAGVSKGAAEVRKFLDKHRANRVILLSDGIANVGPSCPAQLGELGASLIKEGISVTTIGLGSDYNEDLMTQLARKSDGNHYFAEGPEDLARIFKGEFGDVLSVCAQEVSVEIKCADGIRPVRLVGREGDITGQTITVALNQLYSDQEKYIVAEVEVPPSENGSTRDIAGVRVTYANMATRTTDKLASSVAARFTKAQELVEKSLNPAAMVSAVEQIATDRNRVAVALRDAGKIDEARKLLNDNSLFLLDNATRFNSARLKDYGFANDKDAQNLDAQKWNDQRKLMRAYQEYNASQQYCK